MGYSNYKKIKTVSKKFKVDVVLERLFENVKRVEPSSWLKESLEFAELMPLTNEKSKSERIVSPILLEVVKSYSTQITLFSGENIDIQPENDLSGECDFFFGLHPPKPFIDTPIISLTEAKDEDMELGIGQCAAQMYGARLFNEADGKNIPVIYGCVTNGLEWQFLKLYNNCFYVDKKVYTDLSEVLGVWHTILKFYLGQS
ncbi:MAG: hypothetical protein RIS64_3817 [Bacteroidota bacterium]|jgi:hypothetical protein